MLYQVECSHEGIKMKGNNRQAFASPCLFNVSELWQFLRLRITQVRQVEVVHQQQVKGLCYSQGVTRVRKEYMSPFRTSSRRNTAACPPGLTTRTSICGCVSVDFKL